MKKAQCTKAFASMLIVFSLSLSFSQAEAFAVKQSDLDWIEQQLETLSIQREESQAKVDVYKRQPWKSAPVLWTASTIRAFQLNTQPAMFFGKLKKKEPKLKSTSVWPTAPTSPLPTPSLYITKMSRASFRK